MDSLGRLLGSGASNGPLTPLEIVAAIGLSFLLTSVIAAVYRATHRGSFYTQDYVHTLMILGMVVTAVIMVVGQSLERAFAVFAPTRATHLLRIRVANTVDYDRAYGEPFERLFERAELRAIESAQSKTMTELRYAVNLRPGVGQREVVADLSGREGVDRVLMLEPVPERDY